MRRGARRWRSGWRRWRAAARRHAIRIPSPCGRRAPRGKRAAHPAAVYGGAGARGRSPGAALDGRTREDPDRLCRGRAAGRDDGAQRLDERARHAGCPGADAARPGPGSVSGRAAYGDPGRRAARSAVDGRQPDAILPARPARRRRLSRAAGRLADMETHGARGEAAAARRLSRADAARLARAPVRLCRAAARAAVARP